MILKKKIKSIVDSCFKNSIYVNNSISFTYKKNAYRIIQCSFLEYELSKNGKTIYIGNYFQLCGFLKAFKGEEFQLKDPQFIIPKLNEVLDTKKEELNKEITELKKKIVVLTSNNESLSKKVTKLDDYKREIQKLNNNAKCRNFEIKKQYKEIKQLKQDCQEAANLIETLYYNSEEIIKGTKRYKLDHFPEDVQDFITDLIKEYYNK